MRWIKKSIVRVIGMTILFFTFLLFFTYYIFLDVYLKDYFEQQAQEQLLQDSENISANIEIFLQKYIIIVDQAKDNPDFIKLAKEVKDRDDKRKNPLYLKVTEELANISALDKNIALSYLSLAQANDLITDIYDYDINQNYNLSSRQWYLETIKKGRTTVTTPYQDMVTGKMAVTVAAPLVSDGMLLGAFSLDIMMEDIYAMMESYQTQETGYAVLVYNSGQILYHPDMDTSHSDEKRFLAHWLGSDLTKTILSGERGIASFYYKGEACFIAYMPMEELNMTVLTIIPTKVVFAPLNGFLTTNFCILAGLMLALLFSIVFLKRYISTPVVQICRELERFSASSQGMCLPKKYLARSDEIGILANGLTFMLDRLTDYLCEIESKNQELSNAKEEISVERSLFKTTIHSLGDGVISTDEYGRINIMNQAAEELTGWTMEEAKGLEFKKVFHIVRENTGMKCACPVSEVLEQGKPVGLDEDAVLIQKSGARIAVEDSAAPIKDEYGCVIGAVIVFRDFTEKKLKQEQILYLNYHDHLTGLHNRRFFEEELRRLDTDCNLPLSMAMADVNGLKLTNDAFGHAMGDELLRRVAKILKAQCGKEGVVARVGGDEFTLLLPRTTLEETEACMKRIHQAIAMETFNDIIISVSIGADTKQSPEDSIDQVIMRAEKQMYAKKITESQSMRNRTIQAILHALNEKNERERIHSEKVSKLSREIGEKMGLGVEVLRELETAGLMHDIGKIIISDDILNKPGKLTPDEYQEIKKHPACGYQILRSVDAYSSLAEHVLYHHERWDGTGYPHGLSGTDIPLLSRIITVADAFEAMTAKRPYKEPISAEAAKEELVRQAGRQFDPEVVQIFVETVL
ncbi:diguanylate cyclase [Aminipila butyrica]|uniref:Diguanylate cyclase n=1 Tax=Aminipila butyrica TaxID=433296 RepID=A0A858BWQ4_9FIRM|nr:HD domain-containing phosphohydrolase [Aminipila butyrica]QIB69538.1 diguanylate cyclase [Aminipila butyrica]